MDYYSKDLQELITKDKVNVLRTPQGVFDAQIKAWDGLIAQLGSRPLHEEGDGLAEGMGAARRVLRHDATRPTTRAPSTITSRAC